MPNALAANALAQGGPEATSSKPPLAAKKPVTRPAWNELSKDQQTALLPLATSWNTLPANRKRKWLALSKNFQDLSAAEQELLHSRMRGWMKLSQEQRDRARINFAQSKGLTSEEKSEKWQSYLQLSPQERKELVKKAPRPAGAAIVKHTRSDKAASTALLAKPMRDTEDANQKPDTPKLQRKTLLPVHTSVAVNSKPAATGPSEPSQPAETANSQPASQPAENASAKPANP